MTETDILIIGAGPGGAATARRPAAALGAGAGDCRGGGRGLGEVGEEWTVVGQYVCSRGGAASLLWAYAVGFFPPKDYPKCVDGTGAALPLRAHLGVERGVLVVGAAAVAAAGAGHVGHRAACVDNHGKLLGGGTQVQRGVKVPAAADGAAVA